tara:strand:+ start:2507 stop:3583 length:1077 start_codon:yes stop_codon:yes gene_type:complete
MGTPLIPSLFTITVNLAALTPTAAGFAELTLFVDEAAGNALGGVRYLTYTTLTAAQASQASGEISAAVLAQVAVAFDKDLPRPVTSVRVCRVDTGGGETYAAAYALYLAANPGNVWGICMDSRNAAVQAALAAAIVTEDKHVLFIQSAQADIITTGAPATFVADTRTVGIFHDTATAYADMGMLANRASFDPDVTSVGWNCALEGVAAYATDLTTAQVDFGLGNYWNIIGDLGTSTAFLTKGVALTSRGVHEALTRDWMKVRTEERMATLVQTLSARGQKILVNDTGLQQVAATVNEVFAMAEAAQHLAPTATSNAYTVSPQSVSAADVTAARLRVNAVGILGGNATSFTFVFDLTQT